MGGDIPLQTSDYSNNEKFVDYYVKASQSKDTLNRFASICSTTQRIYKEWNPTAEGALEVADIGCGAGTQSMMWSAQGHHVHGLDITEPLLILARERARASGLNIDFRIGTATSLPWGDESMDICLVPELLEHVADWRPCLNECARIVKPGGLLFLTTTNVLCPKQQEFDLPFYSWYPATLKRYYERLSVTTRPEIVNHAKYPAVNWFTFYGLREILGGYGFHSLDRFDVMDLSSKGLLAKALVTSIQMFRPLRWLAHVMTPSLILVAIKDKGAHL